MSTMNIPRSPTKKTRKMSAFQSKTPQDEEIEQLYLSILQKQKSGYELSELIPADSQTFELIKYILLKPIKHPNEIYVIKLYLFHLDKFMKIFKGLSENLSIDDLISKIGGQLKCEIIPQDKIICKQGDKGDKCYVVLKGTISILIQKEYLEKISEIDYVKYLIRLFLYNEHDLMNRVLLGNRTRFLIEEKDIIIIAALFRLYKYYIDFIGTRFRYISDYLKNEKEAEERLNAKYECHIVSTLQFFPLDDFQFNELFDYYVSVYDSIAEGIDQKMTLRKGISVEEYKRELYEAVMTNSHDSSYNEVIYTGAVEDYCRRFEPCISTARPMTNELKLFTYVEVVALREGNIFGDVALQKASQKRTATVITKTDCVFGTLTKGAYDLCLKGTQDKVRLWNVYFFLNGPLFKEVNQTIFESKYFNFFKQEELKRGQRMFSSGQERATIYFIRQGELEMSSRLTFKQLNHIIRTLGGHLNEEAEKKFATQSTQFDHYYNHQAHSFRFCFMKDNEIAGLDDFIINDKYFCDCYCSSSKIGVFSLEKQFYVNMVSDKQINKNIQEYVATKRKVFLDLLISVRQAKLSNEMTKIAKEERAERERYYNSKKVFKLNKVKTTSSLVKPTIFTSKAESFLVACGVTNKEKSRNVLPFLHLSTTTRRLPPTNTQTIQMPNSLIRSKINLKKCAPYRSNERMLFSLEKKLNHKLNTSLTKGASSRKTLSPPQEEKTGGALMSSLSKTISVMTAPFTITRMKKVILPQSTSGYKGYKEYKTVYTESRLIRTDTFFYNNLNVFDNVLKQKQLPKAKRGIIDCLVLDKWEENNNK